MEEGQLSLEWLIVKRIIVRTCDSTGNETDRKSSPPLVLLLSV